MTRRLTAIALVALLAAVLLAWAPWRGEQIVITADFTDTTGIYEGNEVQYLGVPIGKITDIEPRGPVMRVRMKLDPDTRIPADAGAEIMQSALLTDRFIQLGPVYQDGPTLPDGAHIGASHTRSPINWDDLGRGLEDLLVALETPVADGSLGKLIETTADSLAGNGGRIHDLLVEGRAALQAVNANSTDIADVAKNLDQIVQMLANRDQLIRRFSTNLTSTSTLLKDQTKGLDGTLRSLSRLARQVQTFLDANREVLKENVNQISGVATTIESQLDHLANIWDYMPMGAENIARAYNPEVRAMTVALAVKYMLPFSQPVRDAFCNQIVPALCESLTNPEGTGPLDVLFDFLSGVLPETLLP